MRYLSVCSGIEAASVAWPDWQPVAFAEIDAFPCAVLAHYYAEVPNLGDITRFHEWPDSDVDVLVGGTPCQSFSIAGFRKGLADPRGNLALTYLAIAARYRPAWILWENVPGVLSLHQGRDFTAFLSGLGQLGYGWAYRVMDAQFFRVAQRRRRVFVVGSARGWASAAAVLFERESLRGDLAPSREARESIAAPLTAGSGSGSNDPGRRREDDINLVANPIAGHHGRADLDNDTYIARCVTAREGSRQDYETETLITHTLRADGFDASEDGTGRGTPLVVQPYTLAVRGRGDSHQLEFRQDGTANAVLTPNGGRAGIGVGAIAFHVTQDPISGDVAPAMSGGNRQGCGTIGVAINLRGRDGGSLPETSEVASLRAASGGSSRSFVQTSSVRRLTPRECERLQGFPDDYTLIQYKGKPAADSPRYKALGNSMAVPVMRWLGGRIALVDSLLAEKAA